MFAGQEDARGDEVGVEAGVHRMGQNRIEVAPRGRLAARKMQLHDPAAAAAMTERLGLPLVGGSIPAVARSQFQRGLEQ